MDADEVPPFDGWFWVLGESLGRCGRLRLIGPGSRGEPRGVGPEEPGGVRRFGIPSVASAKPTAGGRGRRGVFARTGAGRPAQLALCFPPAPRLGLLARGEGRESSHLHEKAYSVKGSPPFLCISS